MTESDNLSVPQPAIATTLAPTVPRAALYCRVSTPGQQENGSLEEQEARGRVWCAEHGYSVLEPEHVYREVFSGEDIDRPLLDALRDEVRAGRVDVIVADKVDRFSRADPAITAYVMVEAQQYGARVEFVEIQDDSFEGQILSAVLAIVARVEHKRIKERTVAGRRRRVVGDPLKGKPPRLMPGSMPRYGWRYADADKSRYVIHPQQAAVMARAYREVGEDGRSLNAICCDFEAEGIPPPTEALAREGYNIGRRKAGMQWNAPSLGKMLHNPAYWGEAVAYRYEGYKHIVRDKVTNRVRRIKRTRLRDTAGETASAIIRYPAEIWPGIVSKDLAMKALARLDENRATSTRNSKHVGTSFLRAGLAICGHCGANLRLRNYRQSAGSEAVLRFGCGRHANYVLRRVRADGDAEDCPAEGQVNIRADFLEASVWGTLATYLADPRRVPEAYDALKRQEADVRARVAERTHTFTTLITQAQQRRARLVDTLANEDDAALRALFRERIAQETASITTWEAEREKLDAEANARLAETQEVRDWMDTYLDRFQTLFTFSTPQRRKLAQAIHLRVAVYTSGHQPWFEMACDLPGLEATWQAVPLAHLRAQGEAGDRLYTTLGLGWLAIRDEQGRALPDFDTSSGKLLIPVRDTGGVAVSDRVISKATPSKMA